MTQPPLILIGTHRSGTTWLGEAFSRASDVAYWSEPRHVWTYRNWFRKNDVLTEVDATPRIKSYIQRRFEQYVLARNAQRFCEKTPSNCLRIRFIHEIYPQARFVLILRDGRSVIRSTREIIARGGARWKRLLERLFESRPWEWPAFWERSSLLWNKITRGDTPDWGVRPPGWQEWINLDADVFLARQWSATIMQALDDFQTLSDEQRLIVKYEQLVGDDNRAVRELLDFSQVQDVGSVQQFIGQTRNPERTGLWRSEFSEAELERLKPDLQPALERLGYSW